MNFTVIVHIAPDVPLAARLQLPGVATKSRLFVPVTVTVTTIGGALVLVNATVSEELEPFGTFPKFNAFADRATTGVVVTVSVTDGLVTSDEVAVIAVVPGFTPVAIPVAAMVAAVGAEDAQVTPVVRAWLVRR